MQAKRDLRDLIGRFSQAENHFGKTLTSRARVIDFGEAEFFVIGVLMNIVLLNIEYSMFAQLRFAQLRQGVVNVEFAVAHLR